jgi:hypothetical protein
MIYSAALITPGQPNSPRTVFFAEASQPAALARVQALGAILNSAAPTLVAGPRMCCQATAQMLGWRDAKGGVDSFDPMLLSDPTYRDAYRKARIAAVGVRGLSPREEHETLPF